MEYESIHISWYTIFNPTSGGGIKQKKIDRIKFYLNQYKIPYQFTVTDYAHQEEELVKNAIAEGYCKFICIGGDGTIHHMVNGIMKQTYTESRNITLAVIPTGTGNDWVKNYQLPKDPKKAIQLIFNNHTIFQDIGKITLLNKNKIEFFNNAAGIGFDAFVVKNLSSYKKWGSLAYLIAALSSYRSYQKSIINYSIDSVKLTSQLFLYSIGICKYSGAGMQLTDFKNHKNGYFDFTRIESITLFNVIRQIIKLYNGKISEVNETYCSHIQNITLIKNDSCYIQADGELIGKGKVIIELVPSALQIITL